MFDKIYTLKSVTRISVTATASSLAALMATGVGDSTVPNAALTIIKNLRRLTLVPISGGTVNIGFTTATTTTYPQIPTSGLDFPIGTQDAKSIILFATGGSAVVDVWQYCEAVPIGAFSPSALFAVQSIVASAKQVMVSGNATVLQGHNIALTGTTASNGSYFVQTAVYTASTATTLLTLSSSTGLVNQVGAAGNAAQN